jgi:hypothetical protein
MRVRHDIFTDVTSPPRDRHRFRAFGDMMRCGWRRLSLNIRISWWKIS